MKPHLLGPEKLDELTHFVYCRIKECMRSYKSKEETVNYIQDTFQIPRRFTRLVWEVLEKRDPDYFSSHKTLCENIQKASIAAVAQTPPSNVDQKAKLRFSRGSSSKSKRRSEARKKAKELKQQQQQAPEQAHKPHSNVDGKPCTDTKDFKRQSSWEQVRDGYEQAEILQDPNHQLQQEMQRMEIPGNEGSDNSSEDALYN